MMPVYVLGILLIAATFVVDFWVTIDYKVAADISLVFLAGFVTMFTVRYGFWSNWQSSGIGKVFLTKGVTFSLVLWQIVVAVWLDTDYPFRQHIRFAIYGLGAVAYAAMVVALLAQQRTDRRRKAVVDSF